MSEFALIFEDVTKTYPGAKTSALRGVSLKVESGQQVAIVGRSGSGKSTFLHLAAAIDVPSSGRVHVVGRTISRLSERERTLLRRDDVGLVFQFFHLLSHLSVIENVLLPAVIAADVRVFRARAYELLERVGLAHRANDSVQELSGGEMQRVAICRGLLRKPKLLLADEPTGNLDDETGKRMMELLASVVREQNSTLVFVTHSVEFAATADEILHVHSGMMSRSSEETAC